MTIDQDVLMALTRQLGPAAKTFLDQQCKYHLKKDPSQLTKNDLDELAKWCQIGIQLTVNETIADKTKEAILALK